MRDLPRSIHSTPGMIGIGNAGIVPASDEEFGGLMCVYAARTAAITKVRGPCFGHLTVRNKGGIPYRGAFFLIKLMHMPGKPDTVAIYGCWLLDKGDMESGKWYDLDGILRGDEASRKAWQQMDDDECILVVDYPEVAGFALFEPSIRVVRQGHDLPDDPDAIKVGTILRRHPWRTTGWLRIESIAKLTDSQGWVMAELIKLLPASLASRIVPINPMPPSGLEPLYEEIVEVPHDVAYINGMVMPIFARAGHLSHALEYMEEGELKLGLILERPTETEPVKCTEILTGAELAHMGVPVHAAWQLEEYELVLGAKDIEVPQAAVTRPIVIVPDQAIYVARLDFGDAARSMPLRLVRGSLVAFTEPATQATIREDLSRFALAMNSTARASMLTTLRNESRLQAVPELQKNFRNASVVLPAVQHSHFLLLPHAKQAEWLGDREQTFEYEFKDAAEVAELWPGHPNGWVIPEKPPSKSGRKREHSRNPNVPWTLSLDPHPHLHPSPSPSALTITLPAACTCTLPAHPTPH